MSLMLARSWRLRRRAAHTSGGVTLAASRDTGLADARSRANERGRERAGRSRQASGFELGLVPLGRRNRIGNDARTHTEKGRAVEDGEGPDRDREITAVVFGVEPSERAAVDAPPHRLQVLDRLEYSGL